MRSIKARTAEIQGLIAPPWVLLPRLLHPEPPEELELDEELELLLDDELLEEDDDELELLEELELLLELELLEEDEELDDELLEEPPWYSSAPIS